MTWIHEVFIEIEKTAWWQVKITLWWPCRVQPKRSMNSSADWIQARCSAYNHACFSNHCRAQGHNHDSLEEHQGMNGWKSHSCSESSTFRTVWRSPPCSKHATATPLQPMQHDTESNPVSWSCWSNTYVRRGTATPAHLLCGGDKLRW